jgi:DNA polymerase III sliding clamp (beta) subunit (PCNA family)
MISTQTKLLKDALTKARAIALTNTTIPVLRMVALQGRPENAWLTVTASSLDAQIALDVDSDIDEPLACCVDLGRLLTAVDGQGETTKISMEGERVKVVCGRSVFRLPYANIEEFPMTKAPAETIAAFPCEWLGASIARVLPFIGDERDVRAYCRGASLKGRMGSFKSPRPTDTRRRSCGTRSSRSAASTSWSRAALPRRWRVTSRRARSSAWAASPSSGRTSNSSRSSSRA